MKEVYIVADFEATCCDQGTVKREEMEIIEFGVVAVDVETFKTLDTFEAFVKPQVHKILTSFCTSLTTITQEEVDSAKSFPEVNSDFEKWCSQFKVKAYCSWGTADRTFINRDCTRLGITCNTFDPYINLKVEFSKALGVKRRFGMKKALARMEFPLEGIHHRGISDAKNMAKLLPFIFIK